MHRLAKITCSLKKNIYICMKCSEPAFLDVFIKLITFSKKTVKFPKNKVPNIENFKKLIIQCTQCLLLAIMCISYGALCNICKLFPVPLGILFWTNLSIMDFLDFTNFLFVLFWSVTSFYSPVWFITESQVWFLM